MHTYARQHHKPQELTNTLSMLTSSQALVADAAGKAVHAVELFISIVACDLEGGEVSTGARQQAGAEVRTFGLISNSYLASLSSHTIL